MIRVLDRVMKLATLHESGRLSFCLFLVLRCSPVSSLLCDTLLGYTINLEPFKQSADARLVADGTGLLLADSRSLHLERSPALAKWCVVEAL